MEMTIEMPRVESCDVSACIYNVESACHAKAITVGNGVAPGCDTYMHASQHVRNASVLAGVGACKVGGCEFNNDYECGASSIEVGARADGVFCMTYEPI